MSWLRTSPLRQSFSRQSRVQRSIEAATDCDPKACYDSFCKHWQQVYEIIARTEANPSNHDDVLGVVNHLDHMVTLLLVELHNCNKINLPGLQQQPQAPCLEYLLSENLLDKLYEWSTSTGRYANAVNLEQIKLYELLVSHSKHQLLVHEPFLRPLLKILAKSQEEVYSPDIAKRLVILLNQLCVVLMQNVHLLDLFFFSSNQQGQSTTNFIIFSLLIPYVHHEGTLGHQARDALLLCMALSQKNSNVGTYIAQYSSMCPVLVTGLGGLYSRLPNTIEINSSDWHRITPDDVADMPDLTQFINSLEFCNAVVQVAHNLIKQQLLDYMYNGFIVPVLGPAILQIFNGSQFQTNLESQISAMAYLDLILRSVTEPGLLKVFIRFLLDSEKFDEHRILDVLIERLNSNDTKLCLVTLAFFDTLIDLHCEDLMLELVLKYLLPCHHIPVSHRHKINQIDPYINVVEYFLDLSPEVMKRSDKLIQQDSNSVSKTIGANWNHYGLQTNDSLYRNFNAYLIDAKHKITQCTQACKQWSNRYEYIRPIVQRNIKSDKLMDLIKNFIVEFTSNGNDSHNESEKHKQLDSLQSTGDSSGYESIRYKSEEDSSASSDLSPSETPATTLPLDNKGKREPWKSSIQNSDSIAVDLDYSDVLSIQGPISLGPFLNAIWGKLQTFTSNCIYINVHLTGLITKMASFPLHLIYAVLLRPDIPSTSDIPSFHQVLRILKQQIDAELPVTEESLELVDIARTALIDRELRLFNARRNTLETGSPFKNGTRNPPTTTANISATTPPQLTPNSSYDPFKRNDNKRRSLTYSISNMFKRPQNQSGGNQSSNGINITHLQQQCNEPISMDSLSSSPPYSLPSVNNDRGRDLAYSAVILDEWLRELSAIAQEQCINMITDFKSDS